jgi:excisionase family DNA binding protein
VPFLRYVPTVDKMLTSKQVCEALGISRVTLYKYVGEGRLRAYHIGNAWKFKPSDLEKFLTSVQVG